VLDNNIMMPKCTSFRGVLATELSQVYWFS